VIESGGPARAWLIAAEVAVVVVLLISSMLLVRSFAQLRGVRLGFEAARVLSVETRWPTGRFTTASRRPWFQLSEGVDGLIAAVRSIPGVDSVGLVTDLPLTGEPASGSMWRADAPGASGTTPPASARDQWQAQISIVTAGYFPALGIPLKKGRNFSDADRFTEAQLNNPGSRRASVAVINTAFEARYFPNEDPIGKVVVLFDDQTFGGTRTIVGIVADVRARAIAEPGSPMIFLPHAQHPGVFRPTLVVRSSLPPDALAPVIRARLLSYDPQLLVLRTRPMAEVVSGALSRPRFHLLLVGSFAVVALGLAAVGIYGVAAMSVTRRTREIGIRMALGAQPGDVLGRVLAQGMWPVAFGGLAGVAGAVGVTRALRSMLFGVTPLDPVSFALAPLMLAAVALLACYLPARRALRVDPIAALRED
jgi:putative ABC transport system permease protein